MEDSLSKSIQSWLIPVSTAISLISTSIAVWVAVAKYKLKVNTEKRLREATQATIDTKLSKLFTDLVVVAHARAGTYVSDKLLDELIKRNILKNEYFENPADSIKANIEKACILDLPVGIASQDAAIFSIAVLGRKYEILKEPARQALQSISTFKKDVAEKALKFMDT